MKEERKDITLRLGHVSTSETLGAYYIDMRPAVVHYTENLYGGSFDEQGVPMVTSPGGLYYFPINIAQYGFMLHADWLETESVGTMETLERCLAVLEELKTEDDQRCVWWHRFPDRRYGIEPPWASAMAQGELISLYLRLWQALERPSLLESAYKAYQFMQVPVEREASAVGTSTGTSGWRSIPQSSRRSCSTDLFMRCSGSMTCTELGATRKSGETSTRVSTPWSHGYPTSTQAIGRTTISRSASWSATTTKRTFMSHNWQSWRH